MVTIKLLDPIVLLRDLRKHGLKAGDMGTLVEVYPPDGIEVEFVLASGGPRRFSRSRPPTSGPSVGRTCPLFTLPVTGPELNSSIREHEGEIRSAWQAHFGG